MLGLWLGLIWGSGLALGLVVECGITCKVRMPATYATVLEIHSAVNKVGFSHIANDMQCENMQHLQEKSTYTCNRNH